MTHKTRQTKPAFVEREDDIWEKEIDALVRASDYPSREAVLREAFDLFLLTHPQQRLAMAIGLYRDGVVTLARAAELADLNYFDFEAILRAREIAIASPNETPDQIRQGVALILGEQ